MNEFNPHALVLTLTADEMAMIRQGLDYLKRAVQKVMHDLPEENLVDRENLYKDLTTIKRTESKIAQAVIIHQNTTTSKQHD